MSDKILEIKNLSVTFIKRKNRITPIRKLSFDLNRGEILGIVGESGCGKSLTAKSVVGLVGKRKSEEVKGSILFNDIDLVAKTDKEMREYRGKKISMIFQDPMTSLNPVFNIGYQVSEVPLIHEKLSRSDAMKKAVQILDEVGIPSARERLNQYPHQFSGGMRQRVVAAISLICVPEILIADEPTTALDVTIQNQLLELLLELKNKLNTSIILITHDLGVVAKMCDRVNVMYAGMIVEKGLNRDIFKNPMHPYTKGLLSSVPVLGTNKKLSPIEGQPPNPSKMPDGCPFNVRCPYATEECKKQIPELKEIEKGHYIACILGGN